MQKDLCFNCHEQGHWASDCPLKTPKKSPPFVHGGPTRSLDHPVIQCQCVNGACIVKVSKTEKNPGRKFYTCPMVGSPCGFFKWCDERIDSPRTVAPKCYCGAGICKRETETSGPDAGRSYFVCPIKKGFGACKFFQWENTQVNTEVNEHEDESKGYGSPQSTCDSHRIFDLPNSTTTSRSFPKHEVVPIENLESGNTSDNSVLDSANGNLVMEGKKAAVVCLISQSVIDCQQMEFWRQISAAVDPSKKAVIIDQSLGLQMLGWLGRLVFPPSRWLTERPPAPFFCVIFPSFDPICVPQNGDMPYSKGSTALSHHLPNNGLDRLSQSIPWQNLQLWKPSGLKRSSTTMDESGTSTMLKFLEQTAFSVSQLFTILNSTDPSDHNSVTRGVSEVFSVLDGISIENNPVNGRLKEFIDSDSRFKAIEQSLCNERSMEELIELSNEQKFRFDDISNVHENTVAEFMASSRRLELLNEEASRVRDMLSRIENQLSCCEAETFDLKIRVDVISRDMLEAKRSMQEAGKALELRKQREEEHCVAKAALEKALGSIKEVCGLHLRKRRKLQPLQLEESSTLQKAAIGNSKRQHEK